MIMTRRQLATLPLRPSLHFDLSVLLSQFSQIMTYATQIKFMKSPAAALYHAAHMTPLRHAFEGSFIVRIYEVKLIAAEGRKTKNA